MTNWLGRCVRAVLQTRSSTGEPSCFFKNARVLQCPFPGSHTSLRPPMVSYHLLYITSFPSPLSLAIANERPRVHLHLPGLIRTQTQLLRLDGRWIS